MNTKPILPSSGETARRKGKDGREEERESCVLQMETPRVEEEDDEEEEEEVEEEDEDDDDDDDDGVV